MQALMSKTVKKTSIIVMFEHSVTKGFTELICIQGFTGKMGHFKSFVLILGFLAILISMTFPKQMLLLEASCA